MYDHCPGKVSKVWTTYTGHRNDTTMVRILRWDDFSDRTMNIRSICLGTVFVYSESMLESMCTVVLGSRFLETHGTIYVYSLARKWIFPLHPLGRIRSWSGDMVPDFFSTKRYYNLTTISPSSSMVSLSSRAVGMSSTCPFASSTASTVTPSGIFDQCLRFLSHTKCMITVQVR